MNAYLFIKEIAMCTSCAKLSQSQTLLLQPTLAQTCLQPAGENHCAPIQNELTSEMQATGFTTELRKILANMARY